jgi:hypothetical protein
MRCLAASIFLVLCGSAAAAQDYRIEGFRVVERGIYTADVARRKTHPNETIVDEVTGIRLIESTTAIPARKGIRFGLRYVILGSPAGVPIELQLVTRFPAPGLRRPRSTSAAHHLEYDGIRSIGQYGYRDYAFEHEWEMVPGTWTFEFWHKDRKLGSQDFCVYVTAADGRTDSGDASSCEPERFDQAATLALPTPNAKVEALR